MFGSKKRAKIKAEQQRMKDEAFKAKYAKEDAAKYAAKNKAEEAVFKQYLTKNYKESWGTLKDSGEPETIIEGTLGNGVKFSLEFDDESSKKNLQMIVAVLNLHIMEFMSAETKVAQDAAQLKAEASNREYNENARRDKLNKESREHELKIIAAKKEAGIPLATSQLNGQIGNGNSGSSYKLDPNKPISGF